MPLGGMLVAGGASILSGVLGGKGAKKAAKAQVKLGREALALQGKMFDTVWGGTAPWRDAGGKAVTQAFDMTQPGYDYTASPGYQFRLSEGLKGVENSAAARGVLQAGGTFKDIDKYAEGLAASDYGDQFNRLSTIAGLGNSAMSTGAGAANNYANGGADTLTGIGNAKASGYVGQANAWTQGLGNLATMAMMGGGGGGFGGGGMSFGGW